MDIERESHEFRVTEQLTYIQRRRQNLLDLSFDRFMLDIDTKESPSGRLLYTYSRTQPYQSTDL